MADKSHHRSRMLQNPCTFRWDKYEIRTETTI